MKLKSFSNRYTAFLLKKKWWVLVITFCLTAFFAWHAKDVITINALENMLPEHDPDLVRYNKLNREYGGDFILTIAIQAKEIFTHEMLGRIEAITQDLEKIPEVDSVISLTNAPQMTGKEGVLHIAPLATPVPKGDEEVASLKKTVLADPFYTQYLIHPSDPITVIYVRLKILADLAAKQKIRDAFVPLVKNILKGHQKITPFETHLAGRVALEYELDKSARESQAITTVLMLAMISAILFYLFRRFSAILLCLVAIGLSSLWTMGLVGLIGLPLNFVTALLPPLILVVAVLDCIHVYATYRAQEASLSASQKIEATLHQVLVPCLVTGLTTAIGFGSLITSDMSVIRHFGLFSAFGIASALFIAIGPLPLLFTFLPETKEKKKKDFSPFLRRTVGFFVHLSLRHWRKNLVFSTGIALICLAGFPRIFIETRPVDFYPKNSTVPLDFYFMDEKFSGSTSADLIINGPPGTFSDPKYLAMLDAFNQAIVSVKEASPPLSVVQYLKKANQALHDNDPAFNALPKTKEEVEQIYLLLQGDSYFKGFINSDYSSVRLHQQVKAVGSRVGKWVVEQCNRIRADYFKAPLESYFTGANIVWMNMERYIVQSQVTGFACNMIITLVLILLLRSIKWGLLSMLPNIFPLIGTFGVMGWFGIPLNMLTTMIASIAIGLAVDDTVHLILHIRKLTFQGKNMGEAISIAFEEVGPAVISTSIVLASGFWMLCATDFIPSRQFGFLGGLTFIFGMLGELILLPALLRFFAPSLLKKPKHILANPSMERSQS